jgi:hypothetical protein
VSTSAVSIMIRAHRALFVAATALLGVAASEVASRSGEARYWLLLAGAALLMLAGDTLSSIDATSRILSAKSSVPISETHHDVFGQARPRVILALGALGFLLVGAGFAVPLPSSPHIADASRRSHLECTGAQRRLHFPVTFQCTLGP